MSFSLHSARLEDAGEIATISGLAFAKDNILGYMRPRVSQEAKHAQDTKFYTGRISDAERNIYGACLTKLVDNKTGYLPRPERSLHTDKLTG